MTLISYPIGTLIMLTPLGRAKRNFPGPVVIGIVYKTRELFDFKVDTIHAMISNGDTYCFFADEIKVLQLL